MRELAETLTYYEGSGIEKVEIDYLGITVEMDVESFKKEFRHYRTMRELTDKGEFTLYYTNLDGVEFIARER